MKASPSCRQLEGTEVDVRKEGFLGIRSRFSLGKRQRLAILKGVSLTIGDIDPRQSSKSRSVSIEGARLQFQRDAFRLILTLANKEKLTVYASDEIDFDQWLKALADAIKWKFQRFYDLQEELGRGSFSVVFRAVHKDSGENVAVKVINKNTCSSEDMLYLQREIDVTRVLKHCRVAETKECFESEHALYIVMEYVPGGSLEDLVGQFGKLSETSAKHIMAQLFEALVYVHGLGVVHRDIKPENLMCSRRSLPTFVKLADFGLARRITEKAETEDEFDDDTLGPEGLMTTPVGTPNFAAPEVLHGLPYGKEVDLFACGVLLYFILSGRLPFESPDPEILIANIKRGRYSFPDEQWRLISKEAKSLVASLLDRSPYTRLTAKQALEHRWIAGITRSSSESHKGDRIQRDAKTRAGPSELNLDKMQLTTAQSHVELSPRDIGWEKNNDIIEKMGSD